MKKTIGIIGGGISGLSAAWRLAQHGHQVAIFQRDAEIGGLIGVFDFDGLELEYFYHFLCAEDHGYFELCQELGLEKRIHFPKARTGFYYNGRLYPFSTPIDLLRFTPIPFSQRIRFGLFALEARMRKEWVQLDELPARPWLIDRLGKQCYEVIWDPLLSLKFGAWHPQISAAWVWHRLHRVARSKGRLGYLEGGTALLLERLREELAHKGVAIHTNTPVKAILDDERGMKATGLETADGQRHRFDAVVSTLPLTSLAELLPPSQESFADHLRQVNYIGVVCLVLKLRRPISSNFWLNVHDPRAPFNGIIEFTNLNPLGRQHGHIVYVPYYVATDHPFYTMSDEALFEQSWTALKAITPGLADDDLIHKAITRSPFAQAICTTDFLKRLPAQEAPLKGLHLLDSTFLYPEDRNQSGHILKSFACADQLGG